MSVNKDRLLEITDFNTAAEYYVGGGTPAKTPRSQKDVFLVQEFMVRPRSKNLETIEHMRQLRLQNPYIASLIGYNFGLEQAIALNRLPIDDEGRTRLLPQIVGLLTADHSRIISIPDPEMIGRKFTDVLLNDPNCPEVMKRLIRHQGGFLVL